MQKLKINSADYYDSFEITLDETKFPIAYANKLTELMNMDVSEKDARIQIAEEEIELELYYEINYGLMAVEAGAVEAGTIYSPYTREMYEDSDDWE